MLSCGIACVPSPLISPPFCLTEKSAPVTVTVNRASEYDGGWDCAMCDDDDSIIGGFLGGIGRGLGGAPDLDRPVFPVTPSNPQHEIIYTPAKSRTVAGLLALFLGGLGIHNFYLGRTGIAVCQLLLCLGGIVTCGVTTIIVLVWAFIEAILIFVGVIADGSGRPLSA